MTILQAIKYILGLFLNSFSIVYTVVFLSLTSLTFSTQLSSKEASTDILVPVLMSVRRYLNFKNSFLITKRRYSFSFSYSTVGST
jgi:hypothetical protein